MTRFEPPIYDRLRITIPAVEALDRAGNEVSVEDMPPSHIITHKVKLVAPPTGLVMVLIGQGAEQHYGLRLSSEPAYPGEWPDGAIAWHEHGQWVPCPKCGSALVWYEAGYVPGYRICLKNHHCQLSSDGRTAKQLKN